MKRGRQKGKRKERGKKIWKANHSRMTQQKLEGKICTPTSGNSATCAIACCMARDRRGRADAKSSGCIPVEPRGGSGEGLGEAVRFRSPAAIPRIVSDTKQSPWMICPCAELGGKFSRMATVFFRRFSFLKKFFRKTC